MNAPNEIWDALGQRERLHEFWVKAGVTACEHLIAEVASEKEIECTSCRDHSKGDHVIGLNGGSIELLRLGSNRTRCQVFLGGAAKAKLHYLRLAQFSSSADAKSQVDMAREESRSQIEALTETILQRLRSLQLTE